MNKEIKFRIWDKLTNKFVQLYLDDFYDWKSGIINFSINKDFVWQQFTNSKDKNGKEIYDGDIVFIPDSWKQEVKFIDGVFGIDWLEDDGNIYFTPLSQLIELKLEIIGNIFENPDLIK